MAKPTKAQKRFAETLRYSGRASIPWWERINRIPNDRHPTAYGVGVALQEIEARLLAVLDDIEQHPRKATKSHP